MAGNKQLSRTTSVSCSYCNKSKYSVRGTFHCELPGNTSGVCVPSGSTVSPSAPWTQASWQFPENQRLLSSKLFERHWWLFANTYYCAIFSNVFSFKILVLLPDGQRINSGITLYSTHQQIKRLAICSPDLFKWLKLYFWRFGNYTWELEEKLDINVMSVSCLILA